ncbi:hypothetical protein NE237_027558 [Protea cynaroides]|uniref:Uncharacterized protein n=1 Tax=Protea cynaroides TaxID=273540 RepID=A0A9Q0GPJ7_9MAGN|nr:hypothetical protein NE237_027558 [Protea cynaroides]
MLLQYGIAYGRPIRNVHTRGAQLQGSTGSALAFGSGMSGGISDIIAEGLHIENSVSNSKLTRALKSTGQFGFHADDKFDPNALPVIDHITLKNNIVGTNVTDAGLAGIQESPFTLICLSNISLSTTSGPSTSWICSNVLRFSQFLIPEPCPVLQSLYSNSSSTCFSLASSDRYVAVL